MAGTLVLHGRAVTLRAFSLRDITPAYLGWLSDPDVVRFSNQRFRRHDEASSRAYLASFRDSPNFFFSICLAAGGQAIGTMTAYVSPQHGTADMGILVGERATWGRGFGQDAWDTLGAWLLRERDIRKLTAGTLDCNTGMLRLIERSGMRSDGARRAQEIVDGKPHDVLYFARFRDD